MRADPIVLALTALTLLAPSSVVGGTDSHTLTIRVLAVNQAGVPDGIVERAEDAVTRIFSSIGITVSWTNMVARDQHYGAPNELKIVIVSDWPRHRAGQTLAVSQRRNDGGSMLAWVFYHRVEEFSQLLDADSSNVLGHILAHGMGHLLLPDRTHRSSGIMRKNIDRAQLDRLTNRLLGFTGEQGRLIRTQVSALQSSSQRP